MCGGCQKFKRSETCSLATEERARNARDYPTHLQERIHSLRQELESALGQAGLSADQEPVVGGVTAHDNAPADPAVHDGTPASVETIIADIGAVPILASSYPVSGDGPTLSSILLGAATKAPDWAVDHTTSQGPREPARLPSRDSALELAQHYIDQVYPRLPFFSLQGFWAQFNVVYATTADVTTHSGPVSELEHGYGAFTVLLILAIAISSLSRSADSLVAGQARRLFYAALEYRDAAIRPHSVVGVQSLLFLIQYATLNPSILDAWYLIGVGMRSCIDLGLHRDPNPLSSISPSLLETRRRLWWSMYSFDRSMSLGCGRPTGIADDMIMTELPTFQIDTTASSLQIEGFLQRYQVLQIQSEIYEQLNTPSSSNEQSSSELLLELEDKLQKWRACYRVCAGEELIASEWMMGLMLLSRPCPLIPKRSLHTLRKLWESSDRFCSVYRALVESNSIFYVQIATEKIYWSGLAGLYSFWHLRNDDNILTQQSVSSEECPEEFQLWSMVQNVLFCLRTLSERWEDGNVLARQFEETSSQIIHAFMSKDKTPDGYVGGELPWNIENFANYTSNTSMEAALQRELTPRRGSKHSEEHLRQLVTGLFTNNGEPGEHR